MYQQWYQEENHEVLSGLQCVANMNETLLEWVQASWHVGNIGKYYLNDSALSIYSGQMIFTKYNYSLFCTQIPVLTTEFLLIHH